MEIVSSLPFLSTRPLPSSHRLNSLSFHPFYSTVESFFTYLKSLSPSATDLELRSSLITLDHLNLFILALTQRLKSHKDFEAVETFMACFLRIHGEVLVQNGADLREPLETMRKEQVREGGRLGELCGFSREFRSPLFLSFASEVVQS